MRDLDHPDPELSVGGPGTPAAGLRSPVRVDVGAPDRELLRVRLEESAHSLAGHLFGYGIAAITVRPGLGHAGATRFLRPPRLRLGGHPLDELDPATRREADRWLVTLLIGAQAADLFAPIAGDPPGYIDVAPALNRIGRPETLAPELRADLETLEAAPGGASDEDQALDLASRIVRPELARLYLIYHRAEARVMAREHAGAIHDLAAALAREPILRGDVATAILERSLTR